MFEESQTFPDSVAPKNFVISVFTVHLIGPNQLKVLIFFLNWRNLEYFDLGFVRSLARTPALEALARLKNLKKIFIPDNIFTLLDYALLEIDLPGTKGSIFPPFEKSKSSLDPNREWFDLLGKKAGRIKNTSPKAKEKCEAHSKAYAEAKQNAYKLLGK